MTRTHFKAIARIVDDSTHANDNKSINKEYLVNELCEYFECINDRFDSNRFNKACNID